MKRNLGTHTPLKHATGNIFLGWLGHLIVNARTDGGEPNNSSITDDLLLGDNLSAKNISDVLRLVAMTAIR